MPQTRKKMCSHCGAPAATFVAYVKAGQVWNAAYCHFHAVMEGVTHPHAYGLLDRATQTSKPVAQSLSCQGCGMSQRNFEMKGRTGCAKCYETFSPLLKPLLGRFHRGTKHVGKVPRKAAIARLLSRHLEQLQQRLKAATAGERYEEAAAVRDEMHRLRKSVKKSDAMQPR